MMFALSVLVGGRRLRPRYLYCPVWSWMAAAKVSREDIGGGSAGGGMVLTYAVTFLLGWRHPSSCKATCFPWQPRQTSFSSWLAFGLLSTLMSTSTDCAVSI